MYITNVEDVIPILRTKLPEYLEKHGVVKGAEKKFCCLVHSETTPSMVLNPKTGYETAHCFGCNATMDIFAAANMIENLPSSGAEWITETLPSLCDQLGIEVKTGAPGPQDEEKMKLHKLAQDITTILENDENHVGASYMIERNWSNDYLTAGSISSEKLIEKLLNLGWSSEEIFTSFLVRTSRTEFFGEDKVTFAIRDERGRPIAFLSRNLGELGAKYLNTPETRIYEKRKTLMNLHNALKLAKQEGLYVVEGVGDLAQLLRLGITNAVAVCGTAFTEDHIALLRMYGVSRLYLCLDWDKAGLLATNKIFEEALGSGIGINCYVVEAPETGEKDPDAFLKTASDPEQFLALPKTSAFEWVMRHTSDNESPEAVCLKMIPIIAAEPTATRRELLMKSLQDFTGVSYQSINADVAAIKDKKHEERRDRLVAAVESYQNEVRRDPDNLAAIMGQHEQQVRYIEKEYEKDLIGINYQLARYDALQELKRIDDNGSQKAAFTFRYFRQFGEALAGGMLYTSGTLIYVGGRANSGKTATCIALGLDVALHDDDAIVIMHFTDDSYPLIEPRIKSNIAAMTNDHHKSKLTIGMAANPYINIHHDVEWDIYKHADAVFRDLINNERLVIIDSEDGATLSALERSLRYIRQRYPEKKILVIQDSTYNLQDSMGSDGPARMTSIANGQKHLTGKYRCCLIATAEYRKYAQKDPEKIVLPSNDDLADTRAMMYRPNAIIHVYNDLNDRAEHADIFWTKPNDREEHLPRLCLIFGKNKISSFKKTLYVNLDPVTVTPHPQDTRQAALEAKIRMQAEEYDD